MAEVSAIAEPPEDLPHHERLSDEQLGNLVTAMGNNEVKTAMLIGMQKDQAYGRNGFKRLSTEMQEGYGGWDINKSALINYAQNSFAPHGLVVEGADGYIKSSYGEEVGDPAGGNLLLFSSRHPDRALVDFFTVSSSPNKRGPREDQGGVTEDKKRAPATRLKILWELATAELPLKQTELTRRVGELDEVVRRHLEELARKGIIIYEQPKKGNQPHVFYKLADDLPEGNPEAFQRHPTLTKAIYDILQKDKTCWWTTEDIEKEYIRVASEANGQGAIGLTSVNDLAPKILPHLLRAGFAQQKKFSQEVKTEIILTPDQRAVLVDLITVLDGIQSQNPQIVQQGKEAVHFFLTHPDQMATLFAKAKEHSPYANNALPEDITSNILNLLSLYPRTDSNNLQILLGELEDERMQLGKDRVNEILRSLIASGDIDFSIERGIRKYKLVNQTQS